MANFTFEALYEAHAPMVYWTAYGMVSNYDTAIEITQIVFMKAYEHWGVLSGLEMAQAKSWLYKSTRNAMIDRIRKERREVIMETLPESIDVNDSGQPEASMLRNTRRDALFALVQALPPLYREPILLHYFAELSQTEAASALRITGGTYRSRLSRARALLEEMLKKEGAWNE